MKTTPIILTVSTFFTLIILGCVTSQYNAPQNLGLTDAQTSRIFDADIDRVWKTIDTFSTGFLFTINSVDKNSGIVTANFSGDPARYIDGGLITRPGDKGPQQYTVYMRQKNLKLSGNLNLSVVAVEQGRTQVTVNAQYSVLLPGESYMNTFNGELMEGLSTTWSFHSKSYDTQTIAGSSSKTRTFAPNGALESEVLSDLGELL